MKQLVRFFIWLFCLQPESEIIDDPFKRLLLSMNVTSKCRFNASMRLKNSSRLSFTTTTLLSLGLILIPLLQNSEIKLMVNAKTLNMMQIFLAVSVLVYSIINFKSNSEVRSEKLNSDGDRIKELSRELDQKIKAGESPNFQDYLNKYNDAVRNSENHTRTDYLQTKLQLKRYYKITGLKLLIKYVDFLLSLMFDSWIPILMLIFELLFVTEMLGITKFVSPKLNNIQIQFDYSKQQ